MKIEKIPLNKENLIKIKKIDDLYFTEDITDLNWYLERYTTKHTAYVIKDNQDNYQGYIIAVPIKKVLYKAITNGVLINDININPDMFVNKSKYHYIASFVILEKHRHKGLGLKLIKSIIKLVDKGYYCALVMSNEGDAISKKYMHLKKKINENISVYEIKL